MKDFLKNLGIYALVGSLAGGFIELLFGLYNKLISPFDKNIEFLADEDRLRAVKNLYFDFDNYKTIDYDTGEVLIDYSGARNPRREMIKVLDVINR